MAFDNKAKGALDNSSWNGLCLLACWCTQSMARRQMNRSVKDVRRGPCALSALHCDEAVLIYVAAIGGCLDVWGSQWSVSTR